MAVFAKDGIEVRNLLRTKPPLVETTEPIYEVEITSETEAQKKTEKYETKRKECCENNCLNARKKSVS